MDLLFTLVLLVFLALSVGLIYFVLVQEPKQGGLGSMGGNSDFLSGRGMQGGLVRITLIIGGLFMVLAVVLNLFNR